MVRDIVRRSRMEVCRCVHLGFPLIRPLPRRNGLSWAVCAAAMAVSAAPARAGELTVVATTPVGHTISVPTGSAIAVQFDQPVDSASVTSDSFGAFGRWSGPAEGSFTFSDDDHTVALVPESDFFYGEQVMVILSHDIQAVGGATLRSAGYSFMFWTAAMPATIELTEIDVLTTRTTPNQDSRAYGGIATDLNNDGWADITTVNEVTADLRVFMNHADGTGLFDAFLQPTFPVNTQASPSEPADFNRDGFADICVVNIATNSVSILLGVGDGTYGPQQQISVGSAPRGIAVLDVDGDGDIDIANTNSNSSNMSILLNDGNGVFGGPSFFEGGGSGEWALAAADMNDDGILDLVVGARFSSTVIVNVGNGDATFTSMTPQNAGGGPWMLVVGDVNGDGMADVATANASQSNGAILLGNGDGTLGSADTTSVDPFPLATDLGDLDGDGDLDWVTSSFQGDWWILTNDGTGDFTFNQEVNAPQAASCSLLVDIDNDGDLDLAMIDELADVVILMNNNGITVRPDEFNAFRGFYDSGDLDSLLGSDDDDLCYNPGIVLLPTEAPVTLDFLGTMPNDSPSTLDVTIESSANTVGLELTISFWNFNTESWDVVGTDTQSLNADTVRTFAGVPADHVEAGTGDVRTRYEVRVVSFIFLFPWLDCVDHVFWTVSN